MLLFFVLLLLLVVVVVVAVVVVVVVVVALQLKVLYPQLSAKRPQLGVLEPQCRSDDPGEAFTNTRDLVARIQAASRGTSVIREYPAIWGGGRGCSDLVLRAHRGSLQFIKV